ncbi:hypothetical protein C0Q44_19760 [Paenibacillus sp. PCH8]|uniref:DUF6809 family protein n=1 Tax=Paenibacillus sp. PCH8 TaxID=2066524 RepID=UPI000CF89DE1|nr:DUF6809 family protein [Paenibacillus sp. PCH8]PQP81907.1 hypothetical protein C0Q44_19760 [Paenibacillus sp. PCH8]
MGNIIEELYYGNLRPEENIVPQDAEYRELNKKVTMYIERFQSKLSKQDFQDLEQMMDLIDQVHSSYSAACFVKGFKTGAMVMVEVGTKVE